MSNLDLFLTHVKSFDPYPILYCRDSLGNVRTWKVEVVGNKYRFITGLKNSAKMVTTEWTVCQGKNIGKSNETTPENQAAKEAKAALTHKLKTDGYWSNESDIDKARFFAPMLAHKYVELDDNNQIKSRTPINWNKGVWVSPKMDGLRCIINREGAFSREGNPFVAFPHILRELEPVFKEFPDLVLDGECYTHILNNDFNKIISLAKKRKPTQLELEESEEYLEYHIFDVASEKGDYAQRFKWLQNNIQSRYSHNKWIKLCEHKLVFSEVEVDKYLSKCVELGFEGCMMNLPEAEYESAKRSHSILKYKLFQDDEFQIIDVIEGSGQRSGMMGKCVLKAKSGRVFECDSKGDRSFFRLLLVHKHDFIGKKATVRFQNYTPDGIPRFAKIIAIRDYEN